MITRKSLNPNGPSKQHRNSKQYKKFSQQKFKLKKFNKKNSLSLSQKNKLLNMKSSRAIGTEKRLPMRLNKSNKIQNKRKKMTKNNTNHTKRIIKINNGKIRQIIQMVNSIKKITLEIIGLLTNKKGNTIKKNNIIQKETMITNKTEKTATKYKKTARHIINITIIRMGKKNTRQKTKQTQNNKKIIRSLPLQTSKKVALYKCYKSTLTDLERKI